MKKLLMVMILFSVVAGLACAQRTSQIAFTFLDGYITEKESSSEVKKAGVVGVSVGAVLLAGSGVSWFFGDEISAGLSEDGEPWDRDSRLITTGALAAGGLVSAGTGTILLLMPPHDYRADFAHIYGEEDPLLREAYSAAALRRLADSGRTDRLISGWIDLSIPIITVAARVSTNLSGGRLWHEGVLSLSVSQTFEIISGISQVFFRKSDEELLYGEYEAARAVLSAPMRGEE